MATFSTLKTVPWHPLKFPKSLVFTEKEVTLLFCRPIRVSSAADFDVDTPSPASKRFLNFLPGRNKVHHMDLEEQDRVEPIIDVAHRTNSDEHELDANNRPQNSSRRDYWFRDQVHTYSTSKNGSCLKCQTSFRRNIGTQTNDDARTSGDFDGLSTKSDEQAKNKCTIDAVTQTEETRYPEDDGRGVVNNYITNNNVQYKINNVNGDVNLGDNYVTRL